MKCPSTEIMRAASTAGGSKSVPGLWDPHGGLDPHIFQLEDWEYWLCHPSPDPAHDNLKISART